MYKLTTCFLVVFCLILFVTQGRGELIGYWDFNGNLNRTDGTSGALSIEFDGFGIGFEGYGAGSSINLLDGFNAGSSRGFYSLVNIAETARVSVIDLDFTNLVTPTISFAARNDDVFALNDEFYLEYNIGSGWVQVTNFTDPGNTFELFSYTFLPGVLDNVSNAGIRVTHTTGITALDTYEIDNLQVQAVPEPTTLAVFSVGLALIVGMSRWMRFGNCQS